MADCLRSSNSGETIIACDTTETANYSLAGFTENNAKTKILPMYTDNSIYATLETLGININTDNHILEIGDSQSSINPRIDVIITTLNNRVGDETINIYGIDSNQNPSSLRIKNLTNNFGNLSINGEHQNEVSIENATISEDLFIKNVNATFGKISARDIFVNNSELNLISSEEIDVNSINVDNNSTLNIEAGGRIGSIISSRDIVFSGLNNSIYVNSVNSSSDIILRNNMNVTIDNIVNNNKIVFLGEGRLSSNQLNVADIKITNLWRPFIEGRNKINVINDIQTDSLYVENASLDLSASNIQVKETLFLKKATLKIQGNLNANYFDARSSNIDSSKNLQSFNMQLSDSNAVFKDVSISKGLLLENSLLRVENFEFISFEEDAFFSINITNNIMGNQGSLKSGIYAKGDINISNNVDLNLMLMGTDGIKEGESVFAEIMYSEKGDINYKPHNSLIDGSSAVLKIDYHLIKNQGTSFVIEMQRMLSYCEALSKAGEGCSTTGKIEYTGEAFVSDTAKILDGLIKEDIPISDNLSKLISALDRSSLDNLELNLASLKPISNDVLIFESYHNSKFIKDLQMQSRNTKQNVSVFSSSGKIKDNILHSLSDETLLGVHYGFSMDENLDLGLALSKSNISNYLYDIDNFGLMFLSSYRVNFNEVNLDLIGSYGLNKYDSEKVNFNKSISQSSSILNNISLRVASQKNYNFESLVVSSKFYYDFSYIKLNGYKERGLGYLYEVASHNSLISEYNAGVDVVKEFRNNTKLFAGLNVFYVSYSSDTFQARPYESVESYILFETSLYSGLGISANMGVDFELKNTQLNLAYSGYFYKNDSFLNGLTLKVKL